MFSQPVVRRGGSGSDVTLESIPKRLHYDAFGRLYKVEEHSAGAAKARVHTTYGYDHADRLRTVTTSHGGVSQKRTFSYDLRGFLVGEDHPERTAGHAPKEIQYSDYDALGNVGFVRDAWRKLCHRYDGAGRAVRIDFSFAGDCQNEEAAFLPLKEWQWSNASSGSNRSGGKVTRLVRHNHLTLYRPDREDHVVRVEQELEYRGRGGLASSRRTGVYVNGNLSNAFSQGFEYDDLGATTRIHYPKCEGGGYATPCTNDPAPSRSVSFEYGRGFLRKVPGYLDSVGYHRNQALVSIAFRNGVTETHTLDPYSKRRPRRISTSGVGSNRNWSTGTYTYDGSGNILSIGGSWYRYDAVNRLAEAGVHLARNGAGIERRQVFTYDVFGNLQRTAGGGGRATPTSQHTNRLTVAGTSYQQDGSLVEADGRIFRYGAFGEVLCASSVFPDNPCVQDDGSTSPPSQQTSAVYIYDASGERIWEYDLAARSQWAIRDLGGQVLREYTTDNGVFTYEDTIRGLGRVLAAETSEGRRYLHTDHLGTVRQTTDAGGNEVAYDVYYPYGREATTSDQDGLQWKFTGHERDFNHTGSAEDDLDYMHARYYYPTYSRFTSTDPSGESYDPMLPQSWNRYAYVRNNPIINVDPDGEAAEIVFDVAMAGISINQARNDPSFGNILGAVLDVAGAALPFVPSVGGRFIDGLQAADKALDGNRVVGTAVRKTDRFKEHLTPETLDAARRELAGEVVSVKPDGTPFDHVQKVRNAQRGLQNRISAINTKLSGVDLPRAEREALTRELADASKLLDQSRKFVPK